MKKTLGVFSILNAIFLVCFIAISIALGFEMPGMFAFDAETINFWTLGLVVFTELPTLIAVGFQNTDFIMVSIFEILALLSALLLVVFTVTLIVVASVKKKPAMISLIVLLILDFVFGFFLCANFVAVYYPLLVFAHALNEPLYMTYMLVSIISGGLSFILGIFVFAFALAAMKTKRVKAAEPILEEEPVLADKITEPTFEEILMAAAMPEPEPVHEFLPEPEPEDLLKEEEPVLEEPKEAEPAEEHKPLVVNISNVQEAKDKDETPRPVEEPKPAPKPAEALDPNSLASMLRDIVRDIVRDEIARSELNKPTPAAPVSPPSPTNSSSSVTGATFGGPLVVQYFNGGIPGIHPPCDHLHASEELPAEPAVKEAPLKSPEVKPEESKPAVKPQPVVQVVVKPKEEVEPVLEAEPVVVPKAEPVVEKEVEPLVPPAPAKVYERISFTERMLSAEKDMKDNYNELKNEILSYGVNSRISNSGDTFRLRRKTYVKLTIAGKSLKLYFALDPNDYKNSMIPVQDGGDKEIYRDIPLIFKVKSGLSMRRAKQLIQDTMDKDGLEQGEIGTTNWAKELKANAK
ncbi:MAG: hypothetical protein WCZ24_02310 [Bacilli bacterium]